MFEKGKEDLLEYIFRFMISKELRQKFLDDRAIEINLKNTSYEKGARLLRKDRTINITVKEVTKFARDNMYQFKSELYIRDLKSGLLRDHNWHGAMPSFLHLAFQSKVRAYCAGNTTLKRYIEIGTDIVKQEAFIVVTHDLCENQVISSFDKAIPSLAKKGVSDFIFDNIPYDLKLSGIPEKWTLANARNNIKKFAMSLYEGADTERLRKQAEKSINDWGLNRFYVIVVDTDKWLRKPKAILDDVVKECKKLGKPLHFQINGLNVLCQVIFID